MFDSAVGDRYVFPFCLLKSNAISDLENLVLGTSFSSFSSFNGAVTIGLFNTDAVMFKASAIASFA
jgi:hypothetical protein